MMAQNIKEPLKVNLKHAICMAAIASNTLASKRL